MENTQIKLLTEINNNIIKNNNDYKLYQIEKNTHDIMINTPSIIDRISSNLFLAFIFGVLVKISMILQEILTKL